MDNRYLTEDEVKFWKDLSEKIRQAHDTISQCHVDVLLKSADSKGEMGSAMHSLAKAEEALSGLSYLFSPQSEWTGGDSSDPANTKYRRPHVSNIPESRFQR